MLVNVQQEEDAVAANCLDQLASRVTTATSIAAGYKSYPAFTRCLRTLSRYSFYTSMGCDGNHNNQRATGCPSSQAAKVAASFRACDWNSRSPWSSWSATMLKRHVGAATGRKAQGADG
jgi:hypothetical protein